MIKQVLLFLAALPMAAEVQTQGADPHAAHRSSTYSAHETKITLPDVILHDSEGREQTLSGLMHNRVVILNFVFTSCTTICPAFSAIMRSTEQQLSGRLGKEVILVSISVDPVNDTPEKLRTYARRIGAGPHWYWLTGHPVDIEQALRAYGVPVGGRPENHPPTILVGNTSTGRWLRWIGMVTPETLIDAVNTVTGNIPSREKHSHAQTR